MKTCAWERNYQQSSPQNPQQVSEIFKGGSHSPIEIILPIFYQARKPTMVKLHMEILSKSPANENLAKKSPMS